VSKKDEQLELYSVTVPFDNKAHDVLLNDTVDILSVFPIPDEEQEGLVVLCVRDIAMPPKEQVRMAPLRIYGGPGPVEKGAKPLGAFGWATLWQVPAKDEGQAPRILTPKEGQRRSILEHMAGVPQGGIGGLMTGEN